MSPMVDRDQSEEDLDDAPRPLAQLARLRPESIVLWRPAIRLTISIQKHGIQLRHFPIKKRRQPMADAPNYNTGENNHGVQVISCLICREPITFHLLISFMDNERLQLAAPNIECGIRCGSKAGSEPA